MARVRTLLGSLLAFAVIVAGDITVFAQGEKTFVPLSDQQQQQTVSAPALILAAYGFVWAAVCVYVFLLWQRLGKVERELTEVTAQLTKRAKR